ncbi:hypothetical protein [Streptomyces iakyrus]|uniref:hypothetical protein n=1 Tax=Streptomyces iakyrus TaxID=68219 RepID=UPI0036FB61D4
MTNDAHYVLQEHTDAHDNLLCIQVAKNKDDPNRFGFHGLGNYLKTAAQMGTCWPNLAWVFGRVWVRGLLVGAKSARGSVPGVRGELGGRSWYLLLLRVLG